MLDNDTALCCGAQGLQASLELLPMWGGVDSDVVLFASGNVLEDDGEWAGGQSLDAGASAGLVLSSSNRIYSSSQWAGLYTFLDVYCRIAVMMHSLDPAPISSAFQLSN